MWSLGIFTGRGPGRRRKGRQGERSADVDLYYVQTWSSEDRLIAFWGRHDMSSSPSSLRGHLNVHSAAAFS